MARTITTAQPPDGADLAGLRTAAQSCAACELAEPATQTVFGSGPADARIVFVGEQPGDVEDREGMPFVGPAGRVLDRALRDAGIDRGECYVTNAVKHFRFVERGTQRLHKTPTVTQVRICHPWVQSEIESIDPSVIVALGATAAKALRGQDFRLTEVRGRVFDHDGRSFLATAHPSSVLRADDREAAFASLVDDLRVVAAMP